MRGALLALAVAACAAAASPARAQFFDNGGGPCTGLCRFFSGGPADDGETPIPEARRGHGRRHHGSRASSARLEPERDMTDRERAIAVEPRRHRRPLAVRRVAVPLVATARPAGAAPPKAVAPVGPPSGPARIEPAALATPAARPAAAPGGVTAAPLE